MRLLLTAIGILMLAAGCDIFSTRDAEPPDQPRSTYQPSSSPDILIQNLIFSLSDKDVQNYLRTLSDSANGGMAFDYIPSAGSQAQFPVLLEEWSKQEEEQYFNNLRAKIPDDDPIVLSLTDVRSTPLGDSVVYSSEYLLTVPHTDPQNPTEFRGEVRFKMIRGSDITWSIFSWQDIRNSDLPTWSDLRGLYY